MANIVDNNVHIRGPKQALYAAFRRAGLFAPDQPIDEQSVREAFASGDFTLGSILTSGMWRSYYLRERAWEYADISYKEGADGFAHICFDGASKWSSILPWAEQLIDELPEKAEFLVFVSSSCDDGELWSEDFAWDGRDWLRDGDPEAKLYDFSYEPLADDERSALRASAPCIRVSALHLRRILSFFRIKMADSRIRLVELLIEGNNDAGSHVLILSPGRAAMHGWVRDGNRHVLGAPISGAADAKPCALPSGVVFSLNEWLGQKDGMLSLYSDGSQLLVDCGADCFSARVEAVEEPVRPVFPLDRAEHLPDMEPRDWDRIIRKFRQYTNDDYSFGCTSDSVVMESAGGQDLAELDYADFCESVSAMALLHDRVSCCRFPRYFCLVADDAELDLHEYITLPVYAIDLYDCKWTDYGNALRIFSCGDRFLPGIWSWSDDVTDPDDQFVVLPYGYEDGAEVECQKLPRLVWEEACESCDTYLPLECDGAEPTAGLESGYLDSLPLERAMTYMQRYVGYYGLSPASPEAAELHAEDEFSRLLVRTDSCDVFCRNMNLTWPSAAASDNLRPVMANVLIDYSPGNCNLVATDAHRMMVASLANTASEQGSVMLHLAYAYEVARRLSGQQGPLEIWQSDDGCLLFKAGDIRIKRPAGEGRFPNYRGVIPTDFEIELTAPKEALHEALKNVEREVGIGSDEQVSGDTRRMILTIGRSFWIELIDIDSLRMSSVGVGEFRRLKGDQIRIGLEYELFRELLSVWPDDELTFHLNDPLAAVVVTNAAGTLLHLQMPLQLPD